jgi:PleD family two-component response regulator
LNKGTIFYFTIPYQIPVTIENQETNQSELKNENQVKGSILIVEDDVYNMAFLVELLADSNLDTYQAFNGKDAIDLVTKKNNRYCVTRYQVA